MAVLHVLGDPQFLKVFRHRAEGGLELDLLAVPLDPVGGLGAGFERSVDRLQLFLIVLRVLDIVDGQQDVGACFDGLPATSLARAGTSRDCMARRGPGS